MKNKPELLKSILYRSKGPLADTAAVNATRWQLFNCLKELGLPIETGTGGKNKYNRCRQNLPQTHWLDAANVGASTPDNLKVLVSNPLIIKATGHGNRQICGTNAFGFPIRHRSNIKKHFGFLAWRYCQSCCHQRQKGWLLPRSGSIPSQQAVSTSQRRQVG
uniref:hypothetical protein n=1 Tax=Microseira wollei TaxID=467598 RepID=UPI0021F67AB6